ncbi:hypothetical protein BGZ63DRAFT_229260 [Mariannaea sp. PMI_226]|nr:hypothetical protein BGZ63DRAFT_229260 [Mariannaea sp. PMI_226]
MWPRLHEEKAINALKIALQRFVVIMSSGNSAGTGFDQFVRPLFYSINLFFGRLAFVRRFRMWLLLIIKVQAVICTVPVKIGLPNAVQPRYRIVQKPCPCRRKSEVHTREGKKKREKSRRQHWLNRINYCTFPAQTPYGTEAGNTYRGFFFFLFFFIRCPQSVMSSLRFNPALSCAPAIYVSPRAEGRLSLECASSCMPCCIRPPRSHSQVASRPRER